VDEQTSWRGHSFTLLIFGGVVILCSIFFILGMLVGRTQAEAVAGDPVAEALPEETDPEELDLTFYESVDQSEPPPLERVPASQPAPPPVRTAPPLARTVDRDVTLQIAALSNADQAAKLQEEVRAMGFAVFVLRPGPDDTSGLHRVQVGPLSEAEVADVQARLEAAGYKPIVRRR
jgi:cell division septation protein DedD